ncbi:MULTISPECIES: carbohydrate ABC transporter permease [unclassified Pseudactinotalea]|uniref:carbohydrate ABC transporter permease n=1 Tax=unclassified Pseudactinotalea TaxID=2649176 RepID=UPI00128E593D|nr:MULTISPECIES: carbohydrate ABC transporter permease [unclassified Pseudactinotalea]MPV48765.1 ABC transporter permease subunit [Pseudactinotalea sp. HY160]QGH68752.1 ABC transporter permease subunit [Pseudactinotalea sp. HY158]
MTTARVAGAGRGRHPHSVPVRRRPLRQRSYSAFRGLMIALVIVIFLAPLLWMLMSSFKRNVDIQDTSKSFVFSPTLANYTEVFGRDDYLDFVGNSLWIALWATALSLLIGVPAAYAMSRFNMRRSALVVLLARIIPGVSLLVPWYYIFANLGWVGGYSVMILSHMFILIPISVYIMMSYFDSMPPDLEEASLIDGLTRIGAFLRIMLRLSLPGIATAGILSFIFSWNNFMFALVLTSSETRTLPVAVFDFVSYASIDWGAIMAASVIMTVPIIVVALFAQRYIVSGLTAGATKG